MDELIRERVEKAGLSEAQATAAANVFIEHVTDEDRRKKTDALAAIAQRPRRST